MKKILYVYVKGGAPIDHAFPRIAACGELHVLALAPLPQAAEQVWRPACTSITQVDTQARGDAMVDLIVAHAKQVGADAVLSLSEFAVIAVARAAEELGLAGAGPQVELARDKRRMRQVWERAGVPIPRFRLVDSITDLHHALAELKPPLLFKPAWGAGSVAQLTLNSPQDIAPAWGAATRALREGSTVGMNELYALGTQTQWLVEEIVPGSTDGWYAEPGYGDYVSVEGIVADGVYHPLCITGRLPPVPPFMEVASTAPCALPEPLQRRIEDASRAAVDALRLDTCGTHTEIKLRADGELAVIETAARFGGVLITKEVEHVFGFDPIGALVRELLGERVDYPDRMLVDGHGAAASLAPIPADSAGNPWHTTPLWQPSTVHWPALLSPGSTIEQAPAFGGEAGVPVRAFDPAGGSGNWLGLFFLTATDAATLHRDCSAVLDGLESALA